MKTPPLERLQVLANTLLAALNDQPGAEDDQLAIIREHLAAGLALHQRVFDLLRHQRSELLEAELITQAEYAWLTAEAAYWEAGDPDVPGQGSLAVQRLETYDEHEHRMKVMRTRIARVVVTCPVCGADPKKPVCTTCKALKAILADAIAKDHREDPALLVLQDLVREVEATEYLNRTDQMQAAMTAAKTVLG